MFSCSFYRESKFLFCLTVNLITCFLSQINRVVNLIQTLYLKIKPEQTDDHGEQWKYLSLKTLLLPKCTIWACI